jgi:hypothetical protein
MSFAIRKPGQPMSARDQQVIQNARGRFQAMADRFPNSKLFSRALANFDKRFGLPQQTEQQPTTRGSATTTETGPSMLSPNDPRSLTDPRMRSSVSKSLLGQ